MKKRYHRIAKVKARFIKKFHKFGVEVPASVEEAYRLDQNNTNTFWRDAIKKEMTNAYVAFHILDHSKEDPVGYGKRVWSNIFDVKMDFRRKT